MNKIIRTVFCLTLVSLVCGVTGCTKAARTTRAIAKADSEVKAGRYERAEIGYLQALRLGGPESAAVPDVLLKLGGVYHAQGRWSDAVGYLNAGLKHRTNDVPSKVLRNESLFFMGFAPLAFEGSAEVLRMQPGHPEAMVLLVDSAGLDAAKLANAAAILDKQPESARNTAAYRTAQGTLLFRSGKTDAAEKDYQAALGLDPRFYRAQLGMANVHNSRKEPEKAKTEIQAVISGLPSRSGAIFTCLEALSFLGANAKAKQMAGDMIQKTPDFLPPYFFLASSALKEGSLDDGLAFVKKILEKDSANSAALALAGDVFLARNDGTNALRYFKQAVVGHKEVPPAMLVKMGYAQYANRDFNSAKASFQGALTAVTNSVYPEPALALSRLAISQKDQRAAGVLTQKLRKLNEEKPQMLGGYTMLADLYLTLKDYDKAIEVMLSAQRQFTNVAELPHLLGKIYERVGPKAEAGKAFKQAVKMEPNNVTFLIALASHDLNDGRYDEAYHLISSAITNRPDSAFLQYIQGLVFWEGSKITNGLAAADQEKRKKERIEGAIASFKESIRLSQTNQEPYFALAKVYYETKRHEEALREVQDYLGKTNNPIAHMLAGHLHEQLKQYPKAVGEYEKILVMNRRDTTTIIALNSLACLHNDHLGELDKAYGYAQQARDMAPRNSLIADTLGWVTFKKGDYLRALALFQEASADRGLAEKPEFLYHFAMANYMVGDEDIARDTFQKAFEALAAEEAKKKAKTGSSTSADPAPVPAWVEDAEIKLSNLKLDASAADPELEKKLQEQLKATPSDPVLLRRWGMLQERRGDYEAARNSYERALKTNPKHAGIRLQMALLCAGPLKDLPQGLELAKKVKDDFRNDPEAIRVVGQLAYRSGDHRLAVGLLEESVRNYPEDVSLRYDFGAALYSVGRVADAEQEMRNVKETSAAVARADAEQFLSFVAATKEPGKHPEAVQAAIAALAKATNNLPALMVVAVDAGTPKEYEKAVGFYTRILKDYPAFTPASRNLGLLYSSNAQDRARGYDLLYKVRDQYSEDLVFGRALGILACQRENYGLAALLLKPVAEGRPEDLEALFYLGKAQMKNGRKPAEAKQTLERAMQPGLREDLKKEAQTMLDGLK